MATVIYIPTHAQWTTVQAAIDRTRERIRFLVSTDQGAEAWAEQQVLNILMTARRSIPRPWK